MAESDHVTWILASDWSDVIHHMDPHVIKKAKKILIREKGGNSNLMSPFEEVANALDAKFLNFKELLIQSNMDYSNILCVNIASIDILMRNLK